MKNYPRLYSLSTLGIRQHQEFDYKLHGFRTDFVGDSGCGKSMIADLIQLVFVGSEAFHSATESMDARDVDTMVLKSTQGRGSDIGYVILNIEYNHDSFLVIGAYLESTSKHTRSFVIQASYDENNLTPLTRPVLVEDLFVQDQIPTQEMLKQALEEKGMIYQAVGQRKKFHSLLFKHNLLTIDLSQSAQILRDYAIIIQSFSRGKSLEVGNSSSLKSFLFGDEKAKEITQKYKKAVEELQTTLKEFTQNRAQIELVTKKYNAIKVLKAYLDTFETAQALYLDKLCAYLRQQTDESLASFKDSSKDYIDGVYAVIAAKKVIKDQLSGESQKIQDLEAEADYSKEVYNSAYSTHNKLIPFVKLLKTYDCDTERLKEIYKTYHLNKYRKVIIDSVEKVFRQNDLMELIENFAHLPGTPEIIDDIEHQLSLLNTQVKQKQDLLAFADINNQGSLGNWAIKNYQPYTLEVESILMHYKKLPLLAPQESQAQYIPSPENLLNEILISDRSKDGFWLNTGAIRQYIAYIDKQLFISKDVNELKDILESLSLDLQQELDELFNTRTQLQLFRTTILNTSDYSTYLSIRAYADELFNFKVLTGLEIAETEFTTGLALVAEQTLIEEDYLKASEDWTVRQNNVNNFKRLIESLRRADEQIRNRTTGDAYQNLLKTIIETFPDLKVEEDNERQIGEYFVSSFNKAINKEQWITKSVTDNISRISRNDIQKQLESYEQIKKESDEAFKLARFTLAREPDISAWDQHYLPQPAEEEKNWIKSKSVYEAKFRDIAAEYAKGDAYRFENNHNYLELCTSVLPEAFLTEEVKEDSSIEVIEHYLSQINEKNKNLNTRKLQRIREILEEVGEEISKRLDTVRQIHNFLNHEEREITGGHRASLRHDAINSYPKDWIEAYIDKLEKENTLFATGETLNELLKDSISLEEKMINAFHNFGGHRGIKPKIEDLLNPNSYFNLSFKMESHATGKTNSGSTGQTYAATALLCIARLSLVNRTAVSQKKPPGIRFMPVDEAEGLGSNFDMLYEIAREFDWIYR
jgi:ABC-type dipeptide/oligopeptide/nickel transport system ATPase component